MIDFDIQPDGQESYRVTADSRVIGLWERVIRDRSLGMLQGTGVKISYLEEVAHLAAQKAGRFEGNLSEFRDRCAIVPINDDDEESGGDGLDPTPTDL